MNKPLLRIIFAIIALVGIIGVAVFGTLTFFFLFDETVVAGDMTLGDLFGVLAVAFACVTAVFFILAYILRPRTTDVGIPADADDSSAPVAGGEAGDGEGDVDGDKDVVPDGNADDEGKE